MDYQSLYSFLFLVIFFSRFSFTSSRNSAFPNFPSNVNMISAVIANVPDTSPATPTVYVIPTVTRTHTSPATRTHTSPATPTVYVIPTVTPTHTSPATPTVHVSPPETPTATATATATPTVTPAVTPTATPTVSPTASPTASPTGGNSKIWLVIGLIIGVVLLVAAISFVVCVLLRNTKRKGVVEEEEDEESIDEALIEGTGPKRYAYQELVVATDNFSEEGKLGQGGFGGVYRGFLAEQNMEIAVKKMSSNSNQGKKEYISEVKTITRLRHRNLVQLVGWSQKRDSFLLVYEYMPNGSLDYHLFRKKSHLSWPVRYKIVHGLASGLLYLHEEWEQCVVHRDIKSSNVMLDSNFQAKLGDFGLARLVDHGLGLQTTALAGTMGYMAPECFITSKASKESDIFSFGVVVLEITCGRKVVEHKAEESEVSLVNWVWELYGRGRLLDTADDTLNGEYDNEEMKCLMSVGLWCAHPDHTSRPSMRQAIQVLNFEAPLPSLPSQMPVPMYYAPAPTTSITGEVTTS